MGKTLTIIGSALLTIALFTVYVGLVEGNLDASFKLIFGDMSGNSRMLIYFPVVVICAPFVVWWAIKTIRNKK